MFVVVLWSCVTSLAFLKLPEGSCIVQSLCTLGVKPYINIDILPNHCWRQEPWQEAADMVCDLGLVYRHANDLSTQVKRFPFVRYQYTKIL